MRSQRLRYYVSTLFSKLHRPFYLCLSLVIFCLTIYLCHLYKHFNDLPLELVHYQKLLEKDGSSTSKCEVPNPDPWDPTILKYYFKADPLKCASLQDNVTVLQDGVIKVLEQYRDSVNCRCRTFEHNEGVSDFKVKYDNWTDIDPSTGHPVKKDFLEVECYNKGIIPAKVYSYHWSQIVPRKTSIVTKKPFKKSSVDKPSVIMFGLDTMSKSNFIRTLPKLHQQLKSMKFIDMLGHVKIADNTYQNWVAMLTGKRGSPTREFKGELPDEWHIYFDDWPLVWKNFSNAGYVTLFAEDRPDIATFNYLNKLNGFKYQPTDHYFRPYWLEIFWNLLKMRSTPFCYDKIPTHMLQLSYFKEFVARYQGMRHFSYVWSQDISHEYLNEIGVADDDFVETFKTLEKYSDEAILIVFSDHGPRYGAILETVIGRLESRLPYLSIRLPKKFIAKYPKAYERLIENSKKMTTPFDLHETLIDITKGSFDEDREIVKPQRGYSLLRKTPESRGCYEANIPEDYCPCFDEVQIPESEAAEPAKYLIDYVNKLLSGEILKPEESEVNKGYECLRLKIDKIVYASVRLPPSAVINGPLGKWATVSKGLELRYRVVIQAQQPSSALLEGIAIKNLETNRWTTTEEIERNNKYGNTSHCVVNPILKKICHCVPNSKTL